MGLFQLWRESWRVQWAGPVGFKGWMAGSRDLREKGKVQVAPRAMRREDQRSILWGKIRNGRSALLAGSRQGIVDEQGSYPLGT